jgi:predicted  nucleic acid-binding Zn-ribbon protein
MSLDAASIQALAEQINGAMDSVANVDQIISDTTADLNRAQAIRDAANQAAAAATDQLRETERITNALSQAEDMQTKANADITGAQAKIDEAKFDLAKIKDSMETATLAADESVLNIAELSDRKNSLQTSFIKNENHANSAQNAAVEAKQQGSKAQMQLFRLNTGFKNVSVLVRTKTALIGSARGKAVDLQRRATVLSNSAANKLANIRDVEKDFESNQLELDRLADELVGLNCEMMIHLTMIEDKSNYYRTCSAPGEWRALQNCR